MGKGTGPIPSIKLRVQCGIDGRALVVGNEAVESTWGGDAGLVEGKADGAGRFLGDGD